VFAAGTESVAVASTPLPTSEGHEASPQPAKAVESIATAAAASAAEGVVGEVGSSSPPSVAAGADEVLVSGEPAAALQERVAPEDMTRAASPDIQEVEEDAGATLLQGAASGGAQSLELACTSWAATSDDAEDDEEVAARNTLECGLNWAGHTFDELILPATAVSFCTCNSYLQLSNLFEKCRLSLSCSGRPSRHQVRGEPTRRVSFVRNGPSWRCSLSWPGWRQPLPWRARS
jgi:hypothetical protein